MHKHLRNRRLALSAGVLLLALHGCNAVERADGVDASAGNATPPVDAAAPAFDSPKTAPVDAAVATSVDAAAREMLSELARDLAAPEGGWKLRNLHWSSPREEPRLP